MTAPESPKAMTAPKAPESPKPPVPLVLISACLLGHQVRYNGQHKLQEALLQLAPSRLRWLPFCPEMAAGLGLPRPPMYLCRQQNQTRLLRCHDRLDLTEKVQAACRELAELARQGKLCGAVLKSRSPCCAPGDAPLCDAAGKPSEQYTFGIFAEILRTGTKKAPAAKKGELAPPKLTLINEQDMIDPTRQASFFAALLRA